MKSLAYLTTVFLAPALSAQVTLTLQQTVDLNSTANPANLEFIGSNPAVVAWNGTDLFVAGSNNSPNTISCGIVPISGALSGTPTFGTVFGVVTTPSFRGYTGLDIDGTDLAASFDNGGTNANGIVAYDLAGTQLWAKNDRGSSGVAYDPGFPGGTASGQGVGWTKFGSARRALQDAATGADIWTTANGVQFDSGLSTFWRDIDFDDQNGDIYARRSNLLLRSTRTGDNTIQFTSFPFNPATADFIALQTLEVCNAAGGTFVIFNDRSTSQAGQAFASIVQAVDPSGAAVPLNFGAFAPPAGNGAYDFSYDAASNTLAILDFANRDVHIFDVGLPPFTSYGAGCVNSSGNAGTLTFSGPGTPGSTLDLIIAGGPGLAPAAILFGVGQTPIPINTSCDLLLAPIPGFAIPGIFLDGSGGATSSVPLSVSSGFAINAQAVMIDGGLPEAIPVATTNGVAYVAP